MVGAFLAGAVMEAEWLGSDDLDRFCHFLLLALTVPRVAPLLESARDVVHKSA
jgi:hypothetical protein